MLVANAFAKAGFISERRADQIVQGAEDSLNYRLAREAFARYGKSKRRDDYMTYIHHRDLLPQFMRIKFHDVKKS